MESKGERIASGIVLALEVLKNILVIIVCIAVLAAVVLGWQFVHDVAQQYEQWGATVGDVIGG